MLQKSKEQSVGDARQQPAELRRKQGDEFSPQADYRYEVNVPGDGLYATIRNTYNGYTMGNGRDGWTFDVTHRSSDFTYYYGWLYGSYAGCGWIYAKNLDPDTGTPARRCSSSGTNIPLSNFASYVNSYPPADGAQTSTTCAVNAYANVRPSSTGPTPTEYLRTYPAGKDLRWRYLNRHGAQWVMARDPDFGNNEGYGSWVFVSRSCLPNLPYAQQVP